MTPVVPHPPRVAAAALLALCVFVTLPDTAQAQSSLGYDDLYRAPNESGLKGLGTQAKRWYMRIGYTYLKVNNKNGDVTDLSGPVVARHQFKDLAQQGRLRDQNGQLCGYNSGGSGGTGSITNPSPSNGSFCGSWSIIATNLDAAMGNDGLSGMGIPAGVSGNAQSLGTPTLQVGLFLDDEQRWGLEAFVLAVPPTAKLIVTGPPALDGKLGVTTKLLPATVILNHYFFGKDSAWRPSLGFGLSYAMFFDTKSTALLDDYAGGRTSIGIKNALAYGPFVGLQYQTDVGWHFSAQLGYMKLKTSATLVTTQTHLTGESAVLRGYPVGSNIADAVDSVLGTPDQPDLSNIDRVTKLLQSVESSNADQSLGSYKRSLKAQLDPYILSLNIGFRF